MKEGEAEDVAITAEIVCMFVRQRMRIELSPTLLQMERPLETSGIHEIPLKFSFQGKTDLKLKIEIKDKSETEETT